MAETHKADTSSARRAELARTAGRATAEQMRAMEPTKGTTRTETEPAKIAYHRVNPSDPKEIEAYGRKFKEGEAVEVPGHYVDKAKGNPSFSVAGAKPFGYPDQPAKKAAEPEETTFEENLARERTQEYLEGRTYFAAPPGEADRVARAQEQAAELKAAVEEEDDVDPQSRRTRAHK